MNTELQQRIIKQATRMFLCNGIKSVAEFNLQMQQNSD